MTRQAAPDNNGQAGEVMRVYSPAQELINNTAYIAMILLGSVILIMSYGGSAGGWISAIAYLAYGVAVLQVFQHAVMSLWIRAHRGKVSRQRNGRML